MKLKRNIIFTILLGAGMTAAYLPAMAMVDMENVQSAQQSIDEVKLRELQDFRKKYKLSDPKASNNELKSAQMALKMLMLQRTGDYTVTGADLWGDKVTNQHLRDVAKNVRILSYGALTLGKSGKADLDLYLDFLFTHNFFMRMPKLVYSNYSDVRKIPTDNSSRTEVA